MMKLYRQKSIKWVLNSLNFNLNLEKSGIKVQPMGRTYTHIPLPYLEIKLYMTLKRLPL